MTDIEERAKEAYRHYVMDENNQPSCAYIPAYIQGDTERKVIDDKEKEEIINLSSKRIADVEASRSRLLQRREHIVKKAWQWMVDWVFENAPHEVFDELMSSREDYIKAMEE